MAASFSTNFNPAGSSSLDFLADWVNMLKYKPTTGYGTVSNKAAPTQTQAYTLPSVSALPSDYADKIRAQVELERQLQPLYLQQAKAAAEFGAEATLKQTADLFPILNAASSQSKFLNEELSEKYAKFKDYLPTAQASRNVAAQSQMTSAAGAEAERDRGTASNTLAAKELARAYRGQTFQMV